MSEHIEFFPIIAGIEKIEPILPAGKNPQQIPFENESHSMRGCPGIRDIMSTGYVVRLWQDIRITYDGQNGINASAAPMTDHDGNPFDMLQFHDERTFAGYSFGEEYFNFSMKLRCPWYVRTKKDTSILTVPVFYNESPYFTVSSGVINSGEYPMLLAQVILRKFQGEIILKKGTPLIQLIAIKKQPEIKMYDTDAPVKKTVQILRNWLVSKTHAASQYRNIGKIL